MIRTPDEIQRQVQLLLGDLNRISSRGEEACASLRIDFLAEVSRVLLADAGLRRLPDVAAFAFWCRRAHLEQIAGQWVHGRLRVGLGLCFHISPSNVAVNFAYSLAFAFLAGNSSVVRLSSRASESADRIVQALVAVLQDARFESLRGHIHLIRYAHSDDVTQFWMEHALGRIVWGGDATVAHMRGFRLHPRSREIAFVDRYSACAVRATALLALEDEALDVFCTRFYNDIYLMDQQACSSPQLLLWVGDTDAIAAAQKRLWPRFSRHALQRYAPEPVQQMDKLVGLYLEAIEHSNVDRVTADSPVLARVAVKQLSSQPWSQRGYFGTVHELAGESLDVIAPMLSARFQTLCQFGFSSDEIRDFIARTKPEGLDRVVPVGRALDMDVVWDGYDILAALTRIIEIE